MIPQDQTIKQYDELIVNRNTLCSQLEAGNPFLSNQDFLLSQDERRIDLRSFSQSSVAAQLCGEALDFFAKQLEFSLSRAQRLPNSPDVANAVAQDYLKIGDIEKAIETLNNALAMNRDHFPIKANLAQCYLAKGDLDSALNVYQELIQKKPNDATVAANIAMLYFRKKVFDLSLTYLKQAEKIDANNHSVQNNIGLIYLIKGNIDAAVSYLRKSCKMVSNDPIVYNNMGVCYAVKKNLKKAITYFRMAYQLNRSLRTTLRNLATAYQQLDEHEKVINLLGEYLQVHSDEVEMRNLIAWSYFKLGLHQRSLDELKKALTHVDQSERQSTAALLNNMGVVYDYLEISVMAETLLSKSLEIDPNPVVTRCNLIAHYFKSNKPQSAKKHIDFGLSIHTDDSVLLSYLGDYYWKIRDYKTAKEIYSRVLALDPHALVPYVQLSSIDMEVYENVSAALEMLEEGLSKHPHSIPLINNYAYGLILENRLPEARKVLDKVRDENFVHLNATRGLLLIKEGDIKEGRRYYNKAISLAGHNRNLATLVDQKKHLELGRYYSEKGNKDEAIRLLRKGASFKTREKYYKNKILKLLEQLEG